MSKRWLLSSLVNVNTIVTLFLDVGQDSYVRVSLDYNDDVHRSLKNFSPRQGYLRPWLVWWTRWKNNNNKLTSSWKSPEVKFLVQGFEVAQENWPPKNSSNKKCYHVGSHVVFSSMLEVLHQRSLGCSVKLGRWRTHYPTNYIALFSKISWQNEHKIPSRT